MSETCIGVYTSGEDTFICDLPEGHEGPHFDKVENFRWSD